MGQIEYPAFVPYAADTLRRSEMVRVKILREEQNIKKSRIDGVASTVAFWPVQHRVFDEILKYEGCPRLDQAAAFRNPADFTLSGSGLGLVVGWVW